MSNFKRASLSRIKTISIASRSSKVSLAEFAVPFDAGADSFRGFVDGLPDILAARDLRLLVRDILRARPSRPGGPDRATSVAGKSRARPPRAGTPPEGKPVILMMGAHVVKVGLAPVIIDLLERGILTHVAMNSAAAIHDAESALWGKTSEDVAANIMDGRFGMARETGEFINGTLSRAYRQRSGKPGYGEALGTRLLGDGAPHLQYSILAACCRLGIPVTVHAAIGTDIVHQ